MNPNLMLQMAHDFRADLLRDAKDYRRSWAIWCIVFGFSMCSPSSYRSGPGLTARVSL